MNAHNEERRDFLKTSLAAGATLAATATLDAKDDDNTGLPTRVLGKTKEKVSLICLGGWHIGSIEEKEAIRIMHKALDEGLTFFDNAWDYHDGGSEEVMGKALAMGGKRKKCFLMTKCCARDAKGTRQHLEDSLRRLKTDVIDLWQFHEINYDNDPDWIMERGALAEALKAQKAGKIRYIGFTGHKDPRIHLKMLALHDWDTAQMPINVCDYHYRSFAANMIPEAKKKGTAVIGMKSLGGGSDGKGRFIEGKVCGVNEARRYSLSQDIATLVVGIDSMKVLDQDIKMARNFKPMSAEEQKKLVAKVKPVAGDGRHERFKSTQFFDGPYHRKQHNLTEQDVQGG